MTGDAVMSIRSEKNLDKRNVRFGSLGIVNLHERRVEHRPMNSWGNGFSAWSVIGRNVEVQPKKPEPCGSFFFLLAILAAAKKTT